MELRSEIGLQLSSDILLPDLRLWMGLYAPASVEEDNAMTNSKEQMM